MFKDREKTQILVLFVCCNIQNMQDASQIYKTKIVKAREMKKYSNKNFKT